MTDEKKAARQGGWCQISPPHFSTAVLRGKAAPFKAIGDTIAGQTEGSRFVRDLVDGTAAPDALFMRLREIAGNAAKMRGFCRATQKYIEQGPA